jgi:phosphoribosylformylglycinamidine (FGAM) synthase-like amidotransferase family enzyme
LPRSGRPAAPPAAPNLQAQVQLLNKYLNDSGKPAQFRVAPNSDDKLIQEINPANGEVLAEFPASEFAALARSVGISGVVIDQHA